MDPVRQLLSAFIQSSNTNEIAECTKKIEEVFSNVNGVINIFNIVLHETNEDISKLGCVLLKRHLRRATWNQLSPMHKQELKQELLKILVSQKPRVVLRTIVGVVSRIARLDYDDGWHNQILEGIGSLLTSNSNAEQTEHGLYLLSCFAEDIADIIMGKFANFSRYFDSALSYAISKKDYDSICMQHIYVTIGELATFATANDEFEDFIRRNIIKFLEIFYNLRNDVEVFKQMAEVVESTLDSEAIDDSIQLVTELIAAIISDVSLPQQNRERGLCLLELFISTKGFYITDYQLLVEVVFSIMANEKSMLAEWDYEEWEDSDSTALFFGSLRVIEAISGKVMPGKVMGMFLQTLRKAQESGRFTSFGIVRTTYCFLALLSVNCSRILVQNLDHLMPLILNGLNMTNVPLRHAALFTLRFFCANLKVAMRKYVGVMTRSCMKLLDHLILAYETTKTTQQQIINVNLALRLIMEVTDEGDIIVMPEMYQQFLRLLNFTDNVPLIASTIETMGHLVKASKETITPLLPALVDIVKKFTYQIDATGRLINIKDDDSVQNAAIVLLATMTRYIKPEVYAPYLSETLNYTQQLFNNLDSIERSTTLLVNLVGCESYAAKHYIKDLVEKIMPRFVGPLEKILGADDNASVGFETQQPVGEWEDASLQLILTTITDLSKNCPSALAPTCKQFNEVFIRLLDGRIEDPQMLSWAFEALYNFLPVGFLTNFSDEQKLSLFEFHIVQVSTIVQGNRDGTFANNALNTLIKMVTLHIPAFERPNAKKYYISTALSVLNLETEYLNSLKVSQNEMRDDDELAITDYYSYSLGLNFISTLSKLLTDEADQLMFYRNCALIFTRLIPSLLQDPSHPEIPLKLYTFIEEHSQAMAKVCGTDYLKFLKLICDGLSSTLMTVRTGSLNCLGSLLLHGASIAAVPFDEIRNKLQSYSAAFGQLDPSEYFCNCLAKICLVNSQFLGTDCTPYQWILSQLPFTSSKDFDYEFILQFIRGFLSSGSLKAPGCLSLALTKTVEIFCQGKVVKPESISAGKQIVKHFYSKDPAAFETLFAQRSETHETIKLLLN